MISQEEKVADALMGKDYEWEVEEIRIGYHDVPEELKIRLNELKKRYGEFEFRLYERTRDNNQTILLIYKKPVAK